MRPRKDMRSCPYHHQLEQSRCDPTQRKAIFEMALTNIQHEFSMLQLENQNLKCLIQAYAREKALTEARIQQATNERDAIQYQNEFLKKRLRELESNMPNEIRAERS
ncbi:hypothetical protein N7540_013197 [Penicillium herquei]|nr:hypothetical protein N7540_013197 [Penicillium herquei]